tara:strand:+ start:1363 stop:1839 length:477 start_codon:yes stop_codon:yes gene_type:complete
MDTTFYLILASIVIILAIIVYAYYTFIKPRIEAQYVNNKEFVPENTTNKSPDNHPLAYVILFTASWCPYCKTMEDKGIFKEFKDQHQGKVIHNYRLDIETIDCSDDQNPDIKSKLDQYNVDGFPSIKLLKQGDPPSKAINFDAKPTLDSLNQFIQDVL